MKFLSGHSLSYVDFKSTLLDNKCLMIKLGTNFTNKLFSVPVIKPSASSRKSVFNLTLSQQEVLSALFYNCLKMENQTNRISALIFC